MYMSVPIGSCGSCDPVITLKPLWGSLGTELSYVVHWQFLLYKSYTTLTPRLAAPA